jgi:hypothetical protein
MSIPPILTKPAGTKSWVMPSLGEIFVDVSEVSEVSKVSGVSIGSGAGMIDACVGVFSGTGATVGEGGVSVLWQAARIKVKKNGIIFFMSNRLSLQGTHVPGTARQGKCAAKQSSMILGLLTALAYGASVAGEEHPSSQ